MDLDNKIIITEKPDNISWSTIHEILWAAHKNNRERGMSMKLPSLSGDELKEFMTDEGHCYVALCDNQIVGTCSYKIINRNTWYAKDQKVAYCALGAVLPEYQRMGIYKKLLDYRENAIKENKIGILEMDTAEHNVIVQKALYKNGFRYVSFKAYPYRKHYSVVMVKWLYEKPYRGFICKIMYLLTKYKT